MVPIIISGKSKSGVLAVGGKCCVTKFSHINIDQCQALPNNQMKHYRPLSNQPKPSGAFPKASDQHLKNPRFWRFSLSPMAECAEGTSPGHLLKNTRANQTSKWTNTYPTNDNQSHLGAFRHIRPTLKNLNFWLFGRTVFASIHKYISCIRICVYTYLRISLPIV